MHDVGSFFIIPHAPLSVHSHSSAKESTAESASVKLETMMKPRNPEVSALRWLLGLILSSVFTFSYFLAPTYAVLSLFAIILQWPSLTGAFLFASPIIISALIPPLPSPWLLSKLSPILDYFQYEQIMETSPIDVRENMRKGKSYMLAVQPHGVLSLCGMCSAIYADKEFQGTIPTGVASALLHTPILKHVMGIFNLISASKSSLKKQFKKGGIEGTVVLYVGGMAELFLSSAEEETLYLKKRKGFIKLALQEGVDIVPIYLFGNTTILSVFKTGLLADLSRKLQVSCTLFWGKWKLPIPRDEKVRILLEGKLVQLLALFKTQPFQASLCWRAAAWVAQN
jgi:hypothetical protein